MNIRLKPLQALYFTQFLSAFADNMILFVIANLLRENGFSPAMLALVSISFFLPYVFLAPLVGPFADKHAKSIVLVIGNLIKALGVVLLFFIDQSSIIMLMLCYFTVGVGAVVYSPAKYGILPELTRNEDELFHANARIEAYTIFAILTGIGGGGAIANMTAPFISSGICLLIYLLSLGMTFFIPRMRGNSSIRYGAEARRFFIDFQHLMNRPETSFALIGTGAFWMSSAVLRVAVLAWIPLALGINPESFSVSLILATTSIGIIAGAFLAPKLIPLSHFTRSLTYGFGMFLIIVLFPWVSVTFIAICLLLLVGFMGGVFIIPMNTVLQDEGKRMVGSGKTIAIQNFIENLLMAVGSGIYYLITYIGISISGAIVGQGLLLLGFLLYLVKYRRRIVR
ncbi:lysophospholipid transporter LplT [Brevibacillus porteri]|uniref:Lysophospholipid transporter LplT n=1 Tax=Brevibacillus porteri TaxID=2126350 RepID=A0ABX5FU88_9BACL|nr:lysophospholipid transporter LplT [Brevibacillus porteri]MED1799738.1 lysophospholipid transporter LplT [Brevibacillus porteri]MED2131073.1 lysophospholipid transporter LplT [Brevibacillus porteri]MED2747084.1 lysophospholipid transporter LplT [Brevibacillus porteri]MED2816522.1 lysophospholipid transporter LplT [Brevibacillus porteri]MED2894209.1 lysophospholipid transporter LplT [Brevibacillus porteri]